MMNGSSNTGKPSSSTSNKLKMSREAIEARKYFYDKFLEIRGYRYGYSYQKDAAVFQWACNIWPLIWVKGFIDFYLHWRDDFVMKSGWSVGVFRVKVNEMTGLNVHKSVWVKNHEKQSKLQNPKQILRKLFSGKE
ncbi:hypothetical protein LCGC14_1060920 [marine sediment metagenome]|uniref:Uncharacterized protein n=1 Tax=marine sediment metagenome TaxID=412755 RepID=A0A0F9Q429_9ZZZZ